MDKPVFARGAMNVYRTAYFIVKQNVYINDGGKDVAGIVSRDVYYFRTAKLDAEYEQYFRAKKHVNGKRLPSTMYTRQYKY